ncbi:MAG: tetratricopeptide repeat protein [Chitinophagaceae bacterium]
MKLPKNFQLGIAVFCTTINSYSQEPVDTIGRGRELAYNKNFSAADSLLTLYNSHQPDQNSLHLHAQVLYWMKQFDRSVQTFEKAVQAYPEAATIKLDYARVLYELGYYKNAEQQFKLYLPYDNKNIEANLALANIYLWNRNIVEARETVNIILIDDPANEAAQNILEQINRFYSPYITANYQYLSDDQPLRSNEIFLETGWFSSPAFAPSINFQLNHFSLNDANTTIQFGVRNNFKFNYGKTTITAGAGIFSAGRDNLHPTGLLNFSQRLSGAFAASFLLERRPYQYTLASIINPFTFTNFSAGIDLNKSDKFLGRAGVDVQGFNNNNVKTTYLWSLLPVVHNASVSFKTGYGFSFANAQVNTFRSSKSLNTIVATQPILSQVEGIYDPYFTPQNQVIHAALASLRIAPSQAFNFTARGSVGFYATADNPVLVLEKNSSNQHVISKGYYTERYTPFEAEANLQFRLSDNLNFNTLYNYSKLFFYNRHVASVRLLYRFINAK